MKRKTKRTNRFPFLLILIATTALLSFGCANLGDSKKKVKLDPNNPTTVSIWHYYNGPILSAFEGMVKEFNETVGKDEGILVSGFGHGNVSDLEQAVLASAKQEAGSMAMPNVFASYADTAYDAMKMDLLASLDDYFTQKEQADYLDSYIEEGKIGPNGELMIFPIAKSSEVLMLNDTDWQKFAGENDLSYDDLASLEDVARVSKLYYEWTDAKTPDVPNDGKAFFGRDSMANLFLITSKSFQTELFQVSNGSTNIQLDEGVMKKLWDNYYVPYISGYFTAYGRFRSDDAKVGDILAYVGSTSSSSYFPSEVTADGETYPIQAKILPAPHFKDSKRVMVQQGAGMVVAKGTPEQEYASVVFLKWFTDVKNNAEFASLSGYVPVKKEASNYETMMGTLQESGQSLDKLMDETLRVAMSEMGTSELYTNKPFDGGIAARDVLETNLQEKAVTDRQAVLERLKKGESLEDAVAKFHSDEAFGAWFSQLKAALEETIQP